MLHLFRNFPVLKRSFRFLFGELAWQALIWYLSELKWPKADANSLRITWIELAIDFELSTGVSMPRSAQLCEKNYGSRRLGRHASMTVHSSGDVKSAPLKHVLERVIQKKKSRFHCIVCDRSGAWGERSRFMKHSVLAIRNLLWLLRGATNLRAMLNVVFLRLNLPPATLFEKSRVFTDMVGALSRQ